MDRDDYLDEIHIRILRVTEDLRAIQEELNYAAMQAPVDPELMQTLNEVPEIEAIQVLKTALDQMRHFLWFYMQVVSNESEVGEKLRQSIGQKAADDTAFKSASLAERLKYTTDAAMLRYLSDGKNRKPN
jgi:hypothetical protein